jgi:uncharacterized protein (DUF1800 family)
MSTRLGRRGFVGGAAALSAGLSTGLWSVVPARAASAMGFDDARHLLSRTSFGVTPAEIHALEALDYTAAVDRLLADPRRESITLAPDWIGMGPAELQGRQKAAEAQRKEGVDGKKLEVMLPVREQGRELKNWWVEEMITTDQPLVERMTLFWHGHFTSSLAKVRYPSSLFRQNVLFRREAMGNYANLLRSVARDPAMLIYLDGRGSVARQPNENFARELLELFTLGEGQYSEADIKAAARAFTGWSVDRESGQFVEHPGRHDDGQKTFLGKSGRFGGDEILTILLAQPRTAEMIVEKLWREFVSLKPDPAEVTRLAVGFRQGGYEIKPLIRALLLSPAFRDPANRGALIKSPVDLIVGSVRVLGLPVPEKTGLVRMLQGLGQVPFDPPNVKGWAGGESWISTYTLLLRQQFLRRMIEATTVAPMDSGMRMADRPDRRAERREQLPTAETMQMMDPPRPVEGRSLRNAGNEVRLGPTLAGVESAVLLCTLLPRQPVDGVDASGSAGAIVAAALLDTAYQLK